MRCLLAASGSDNIETSRDRKRFPPVSLQPPLLARAGTIKNMMSLKIDDIYSTYIYEYWLKSCSLRYHKFQVPAVSLLKDAAHAA